MVEITVPLGLGHQDLEDEGDVANLVGDFLVPMTFDPKPLLEALEEMGLTHDSQYMGRWWGALPAHCVQKGLNHIFLAGEIVQPGDPWELVAYDLGLGGAGQPPELANELTQWQIPAPVLAGPDMGKE